MDGNWGIIGYRIGKMTVGFFESILYWALFEKFKHGESA